MADQGKTEAPTPKRRHETRQRGQVAKSVDLSTGLVALAAFFAFQVLGAGMFADLQQMMRGSIQMVAQPDLTAATLPDLGRQTSLAVAKILLPFMAILMLVGVLVQVAQVGLMFTMDPLKPRLAKLNPLANLKRSFLSIRAVVELLKGILKLALTSVVVYLAVRDHLAELVTLGGLPLREGVARALQISLQVGIRGAAVLLLIGVADYLYQRRSFLQTLKMTKQEVRDESRQSEGDPLVKNRQKRVRMELHQRMMKHVPTADVVITNPTHYAVALKYDTLAMDAPRVVAKGKDLVAQRIKEIAAEHHVPLVENVPLAQALYKGVPLGREIPAHLYQAVAEILAFVFRIRHGMAARVA